MTKSSVLLAMSGGVDSSVAAALLRERGHRVVGVFMRNGIEREEVVTPSGKRHKQGCCSVEDAMDARLVATKLGIPFQVYDLEPEFDQVIRYFVEEYQNGRTPNPCAVCNRDLKFGRLLDLADDLGIDQVATGHYVRLETHSGELELRRGVDTAKDQSYLLFPVKPSALERALFPVGELRKSEVRRLAGELGLRTHLKPDSQEICFVPENDYRALLARRGVETNPGPIVDSLGRVRGEHTGYQNYTIGQRRGLGIAHKEPLYVIELRAAENQVVVGTREELGRRRFWLTDMNWFRREFRTQEAFRCEVQIRAHHRAAPGLARVLAEDRVEVTFDEPQGAVTPGQGGALYQGDLCLGGGWIELHEQEDEQTPARSRSDSI